MTTGNHDSLLSPVVFRVVSGGIAVFFIVKRAFRRLPLCRLVDPEESLALHVHLDHYRPVQQHAWYEVSARQSSNLDFFGLASVPENQLQANGIPTANLSPAVAGVRTVLSSPGDAGDEVKA
uniref:Uncharacterized protein n=1 Tax=Moniliophthora roreri TaxID=221103 RepID=A0A0W0GB74_MONRR